MKLLLTLFRNSRKNFKCNSQHGHVILKHKNMNYIYSYLPNIKQNPEFFKLLKFWKTGRLIVP